MSYFDSFLPFAGSATGGRSNRLLPLLGLLLLTTALQASHFRYGSISWRHLSGTTVEFKVQQAWRMSFFFNSVPALGTEVTVEQLIFGDGGSALINLTVTSVDPTNDWFFGETTITHTYPTQSAFTAQFTGCCRIGGIANASGGSFRVVSQVDLSPGVLGNDSPVTAISPIVNVPVGPSATFSLPATDADGDPLRYRLATPSERAGVDVSVLAVTPQGKVTVTLNNAPAGRLYTVPVVVEDLQGNGVVKSSTMVDFFVRTVPPSTPPAFDYTVTPADNSVIFARPGEAISFTVRASDPDPGSTVTLNAVGVPPGAVFTPELPVSGSLAESMFNWTPTVADQGTNVMSITATDEFGNQAATAVSLVVSRRPVFDVPPTPATAVHQVVAPGELLSFMVQASDADPSDLVQITTATQKDGGDPFTDLGASFAPALPTPPGNPSSTVLSWTPDPADWGHRHAVFTAKDLASEKATYEVSILVNTNPTFTSTPVTLVAVNEPYTYNVTATDADLPYGDSIMLLATSIPAWLTFTDNGDGTGTLTGVPSPGEEGNYQIELEVQDIHHHQNVGGIPTQTFILGVVPGGGGGECQIAITSVSTTDASCPGTDDGTITVQVSGVLGSVTYSISGPINDYNATGKFLTVPSGSYTVTVDDDGDLNCIDTEMNVVVGITPVIDEDNDGVDDNCPVGDPCDGNAPPVITDIEVPTTVQAIGQILKAYVDYTDADDDDAHSATIDWGDGFSEAMSVKQLLNRTDAQHRYFAAGSYTVTITLRDSCGAEVTQIAATPIVVSGCGAASAAPVITNIEVPTTVQAINQILKAYVDYTDADDDDAHTATIDWGDGFSEAMSVKQLQNRTDAQHRYTAIGNYTVTITLMDSCGNTVSKLASAPIVVERCGAINHRPIILDIDVPTTTQDTGQILKAYVDYVDYDDQDDHTATIDWGDGFSEAMSVKQMQNRTDAQHRYFAAGDYQVTVTLSDGCGGTRVMMASTLISVSASGASGSIADPATLRLADAGPATIGLRVYPNPASQEVRLDWTGFEAEVRIQLTGLTGRLVSERRAAAEAGTFRLDLSALQLAPGAYFLRLTDGTQRLYERLIVR